MIYVNIHFNLCNHSLVMYCILIFFNAKPLAACRWGISLQRKLICYVKLIKSLSESNTL